ncbi:MAG: hypothetical protein K2Q03_10355 [Sphingobacteriaceae bacterium]|nr:hypothetical protein [Sphingobacteriaceae bacterium]
MKKILLALVALGMVSVANAAPNDQVLSLTGTLTSACTTQLSTASMNFNFIPGQAPITQNTVYTLSCTAGAGINNITAASVNGWRFIGSGSGDYVNYGIAASTAAPYAADISTTWNGATTSTDPFPVILAPFTINGAADPVVSTLTVIPAVVPASTNVDNYSDSVTIALTYT